jgi:hypothetical protein
MMNTQPKILIIAPHSACGSDPIIRDCDLRAGVMAENLEKVARNAQYDVKLIQSDTMRSTHDYNRSSSIDTRWRKDVRAYIEQNHDHPIIIYETHSFPSVGTEFVDGSQMALLAINEYYEGTKKMHDYLTTSGVKMHHAINNTRLNNLMIDTSQYNNIKQHYLLEFNEDLDVLSTEDGGTAVVKIFLASLIPNCVRFYRSNFFGILIVIFLMIVVFTWFQYEHNYKLIKQMG